jgi:hypothetical protein
MDPLEKSLLWDAVEGTYLIEIRNSRENPELSVNEYRTKAAAAIERLLELGLVQVSVGAWDSNDSRPARRDEITRRFADASAWDPDRTDLLIVDATDAGRQVLSMSAGGHDTRRQNDADSPATRHPS